MSIFLHPGEVECSASESARAFASLAWRERQKHFWDESRRGVMPRLSLLPSTVVATKSEFVIDFGGGSGWISLFCSLGNSYVVVESSDFVENYKDFCEVSMSSLTDFMESFPLRKAKREAKNVLFYSNSTIQYLSDLDSIFNLIELVQPEYVLFDDLMISNKKKINLFQRYYGDFIPYFIHSAEELIDNLSVLGYVENESSSYGEVALNEKILEDLRRVVPENDVTGPLSLLLRKIS